MSFRGIVNNGVITLEGRVPYPDGTRVDVVLCPKPNGKRRRKQAKIPGFGVLRGRQGVRSPTALARSLRRRVMQRGGGR